MDFDDPTDDTTGATCTSDGAAYEPRRCVATKADGTPCGAWALTGSAYCYMHAPERAAELVAAGVTMPDLGTVDPADYLTEVGTWTPEQLDRAEAIMRAWGWQPEP